ncbi:MAG: hypothetical protein ABJM26_04810 [Anderseniella sp.]
MAGSRRSLELVRCAIVATRRFLIVAFTEQYAVQYSPEAVIVHFVPWVQFKKTILRTTGKYCLPLPMGFSPLPYDEFPDWQKTIPGSVKSRSMWCGRRALN